MIIGILLSFVISNSSVCRLQLAVCSRLGIGVRGQSGIIFGWYPARKAANLQPKLQAIEIMYESTAENLT